MIKNEYIDYEKGVIKYKMVKIGGSYYCRVPYNLIKEKNYSNYEVVLNQNDFVLKLEA